MAQIRPEVVHAHMMTGAVLAWIVRPRARYRLVCTVHAEFKPSAILMGLGDRVGVSDGVTRSMRPRGVLAKKLGTVVKGAIGSPRAREPESPRTGRGSGALERPAIVTVAGCAGGRGPRI